MTERDEYTSDTEQEHEGGCFASVDAFYWNQSDGKYAVCYLNGRLSDYDSKVGRPYKIGESHIHAEGKELT